MCPSAPDFWLDNNYNSNTAVVKQDFAVVKQVDGRAAHMIDRHNSAPELAEHPPPPPDHAGSIPGLMASEFYSRQLIFMSNLPWGQVVKKVKLHHCAPWKNFETRVSEMPFPAL
jgi:hypothetical protein